MHYCSELEDDPVGGRESYARLQATTYKPQPGILLPSSSWSLETLGGILVPRFVFLSSDQTLLSACCLIRERGRRHQTKLLTRVVVHVAKTDSKEDK